jgi:hypothetical protein
MLDARRALDAGFVDLLLEPVEFLDESLAFLLDKIEEGPGKRRPTADLSDVAEVCRKARARLDGQVHGATPAPYRALDLIEGAATWSLEKGYRAEEDALAEPFRTEAQASVYAFGPSSSVAQSAQSGCPTPEPVASRKGIVGAGLMARQLALPFLRRLEVPVVAPRHHAGAGRRSASPGSATSSRSSRTARSSSAKGRHGSSASLSGGTAWETFAGCDLVLEAVFEEMAVKKEVFAELERVVSPECVLATNTSSLSVIEMGSGLEHPERVVGMHFFNPVGVLPLVELVRTPSTDDASLATAWAVTKKLRKTGVLVQDATAFVVNPPPGARVGVTQALTTATRSRRRTRPSSGWAADGSVRAPPARRPEGRQPRPPPAPRLVAGPLPLSKTLENLAEGGTSSSSSGPRAR